MAPYEVSEHSRAFRAQRDEYIRTHARWWRRKRMLALVASIDDSIDRSRMLRAAEADRVEAARRARAEAEAEGGPASLAPSAGEPSASVERRAE